MITIKEYITDDGMSYFGKWFSSLNSIAASKVATTLYRAEQGNLGDTKSVGAGVYEMRINFGPGYRVYFGRKGQEIIILLGGGKKKRQDKDISLAKERWLDCKRRQ